MKIVNSIIIPAYNEEETIGDFLKQLKIPNSEIIVVCNGCTDRTPDIVKTFPVKIMIFPEKIGKGGAILEGMKHASGKNMGFVDADGSFDNNSIKKIISELDNADCVIASKYKGQRFMKVKSKFARKISSRIWNFLVRALLGLDFDDTQAGLKFMKREVYENINKNFITTGFEFDVELLKKIKKRGYGVKEVFIPVKAMEKSTFSFSDTPGMFWNLLRLCFRR